MIHYQFEWDERKNRFNKKKHGISFEEAKSVFFDERALEFYDDEHSEWENRYLLLGLSCRLRMLLVCFCLRAEGSVIRIISARRPTKKEKHLYLEEI